MVSGAMPVRCSAVLTLLAVATLSGASPDPTTTEEAPQRPLTVARLDTSRLLVGGSFGLVLVDADGPPYRVLAHLDGVRVRSITPHASGYVYLNLDEQDVGTAPVTDPLAVVRVEGGRLHHLFNQGEPAIRYEKMAVADDLLLVAAHEHGVRVYSIADPADPVLVDTIEAGLWDSWAVASDGRHLWVADGADGLKRLDPPAGHPAGATTTERLGPPTVTAHDVCLHDGRVYVAAGSDGVAVLDSSDPTAFTTLRVDGAITDLRWTGDHLAAASADRVALLRPEPAGRLRVELMEPLQEEQALHPGLRPDGSLLSPVHGAEVRSRFLMDVPASRPSRDDSGHQRVRQPAHQGDAPSSVRRDPGRP